MLFTLPSNRYISQLVCSLTLMLSIAVNAQDQSVFEKFNLHGFISQGIVQAKNSNFINDSGNATAELTEVGLNFSYQFSNDFRFAGQAVYLNGGNRYNEGFRIDYALIDWSVVHSENWTVNAYIGRFKNYHWLYSSERNVPMSRPSIVLPQSVYFDGTRDMSVGGDGLAISAKYNSDKLGDIDLNISSGTTPLSNEQTEIVMGDSSDGKVKHSSDFQGSIYWQPFSSQWRFGLAYTGATFKYENDSGANFLTKNGTLKLSRNYLNALYQAESWSVSAELLQEKMATSDILLFPIKKTGQGGYIQGQYNLTAKLKSLLRYERFFADKNDKLGYKLAESSASPYNPYGATPNYFGYQHDTTVGLTYDLSSTLKLQVEHHWYQGAARLTPLLTPNTAINNRKNWQLSAVQLTYWF